MTCLYRYRWPPIGEGGACEQSLIEGYKCGCALAKLIGEKMEVEKRARFVRALQTLLGEMEPQSEVRGCDFQFIRGIAEQLINLNVRDGQYI